MKQSHHSLKQALTKSILLWAAAFLTVLALLFLLTYSSLESVMLNMMADKQLDDQVQEFAQRLKKNNNELIQQESKQSLKEPLISAVLLIDASGKLLHASIREHQPVQIDMHTQMDLNSIHRFIKNDRHLHLFQRKIPRHNTTLALVLDDRTVEITILSTTLWTGLLLMLFLLTSIKALHFTLKRQLIHPLNQLNRAIQDKTITAQAIQQLEDDLPEEAANILDSYDKLNHSHIELKTQLIDMMHTLSSCFWWSDNGQKYTGISEKSSNILHQAPETIHGSDLWRWTDDKAQIHRNNKRLMLAIEQHKEKIDIAYQVTHHGQALWYGEAITLHYDSDGNLSTLFGIINDITVRKNLQHEKSKQIELLHRMETTGTLVGGIAHEFNNALAGIKGNIFLIKQASRDEKLFTRVARIESLIERSAHMIDSMLSFARQGHLATRPICMLDFVHDLQLTLPSQLAQSIQLKIQSENKLSKQNCIISADHNKLKIALEHLIDNAQLALNGITSPAITIQLQLLEADDHLLHKYPRLSSRHLIHLSLHDNGSGITSDIKNRVFEPFFTTREVGQGTGLGLSMVYGYMNQIGGAIDLESHRGEGTTFHLYFPRTTPSPSSSRHDILKRIPGKKVQESLHHSNHQADQAIKADK